jgi:hypothetical protein
MLGIQPDEFSHSAAHLRNKESTPRHLLLNEPLNFIKLSAGLGPFALRAQFAIPGEMIPDLI